jgi:type IV secretion system protein VirB10
MHNDNAPLPTPPSSPNSLETGVRAKITGVTRIGPRVLAVGGFALLLIFALIIVGANKPNKPRPGAADPNAAFAAPAPQDTGHFGANVPIVDPATHTTQSLPEANKSKSADIPAGLALAATPPPATTQPDGASATAGVPNIETGTQANAAAPQQPQAVAPAPLQVAAPSADPLAEAKLARTQAAEAARAQRAAERAQALELAYQAPVVIGGSDGNSRPAAAGSSTLAQASPSGAAPNDAANEAAGNSPLTPAAPAGTGSAPAPGASSNPNAFLSGPFGQYAHDRTLPQSGTANAADYLDAQRYAARSRYEIVASSVIPAALITGIDSEQPGLISAQVRQDVFDSRTGRYLLIPKGSRLIGTYKSDVKDGQSRVLVAWERLIFPDTSSIDLHDQVGADTEVYSGLSGKTDDHFAGVFATALLSSILSAGLQLSQPQQMVLSAAAGTVTTPSTGQVLAGAAGQQISQVGSALAQKQLSLPPVIHVPRGYPFLVVVDRDMVLPSPYQGAGQ